MCGWSNGPDGATICQNQGYPRRLQGHDVTASWGQSLFWIQFLHADEDQATVINPAKVHPAEGNSRASTSIVHADNLISRQRHAQPSRKYYECASRPIPQNGKLRDKVAFAIEGRARRELNRQGMIRGAHGSVPLSHRSTWPRQLGASTTHDRGRCWALLHERPSAGGAVWPALLVSAGATLQG